MGSAFSDDLNAMIAAGRLALRERRFADALPIWLRTAALRPYVAGLHFHAGEAFLGIDCPSDAADAFRRAIKIDPQLAEAHNYLGAALAELGRIDEAIDAFTRAIAIKPDFVGARFNVSKALHMARRFDERVVLARQTFSTVPASHRLAAGLDFTAALRAAGRYLESIEVLRNVVQEFPDDGETRISLGTSFWNIGHADEAMTCYAEGVRRDPNNAAARSCLLLAMLYAQDSTDATLVPAHHEWWIRHGAPIAKRATQHLNDRNPDRVLKIGYVSPNLRQHPVAFFFEPILAAHDRQCVTTYCYTDVKPDETTERLKALSQHWRDVRGLSDDAVEAMIRADGIDILVDLAQHLAFNRMTLFCRKPAPVQVSYLGYPYTTGVEAIDYRLSDEHLDPLNLVLAGPEKIVRLKQGYFCYRPPNDAPPITLACPSETTGIVTFGSMNAPMKINESTLDTWARVLHAVPNSRMLIKAVGIEEAATQEELAFRLVQRGVARDRVEVQGRSTLLDAMNEMSRRVDVALDSMPYAGGTTTCHLLWMGVPVVTLTGSLPMHRLGLSVLSSAGLNELVARDADEFVRIAIDLSQDKLRREEFRATIRGKLKDSRLMDAAGFTHELELQYRDMWREALNRVIGS